jgi:hypothetical protein
VRNLVGFADAEHPANGFRTARAPVSEAAARLLLMQVDSWMTGVNKNVAGRQKRTFVAYAGGAPKYRQKSDEVAARTYEAFVLG